MRAAHGAAPCRPGAGSASRQLAAEALRWKMQRAAQGLMTSRPGDRVEVATAAGAIQQPRYRVALCHRWTAGAPALWRSPEGTNAEYSELQTCGSVWHCPICAPKVTSGRRDELLAAIAAWRDRGGEVYLATRTFSHDKHSATLAERVAQLADATRRAKGKRRAIAAAERAGVVGTIRALEVTHGEINGWHPHTHELIFARPGERARLLSHRAAWIRLLIERGLAGIPAAAPGLAGRRQRAEQLRYLRRHAYTVQLGDKAAEYVAKFGMEPANDETGGRWGPGSELTRGHQKTGQRLTGRTPFGLLRLYVEDGDKRAGMLFRDFAEAFHGRRQLFWSPGLRAALLELAERTRDEIYFAQGDTDERRAWAARARYIGRNLTDEDFAATRSPECSEFVYRLSADEWRLVLATNHRFELRLAAQWGGADEVRALLDRLKVERPTHRGEFVADWRRFDRGRVHDLSTEALP